MTRDLRQLLPGKLPIDVLRSVLSQLPRRDSRVLVGPQIGEDAAVIDAGDRCLVVSTDPITLAADRIGRYAVHVNANDVAVMGARPAWFFVVLLLPAAARAAELLDEIMADVRVTCDELGITLCGGHTEVTDGLSRPIVVGQMLGEVAPARLVRKNRLAVGDQILLTGGVAIEGTAILAIDRHDVLRDKVGAELLARAARLLDDPGISVVKAALAAAAGDGVHAMHDPTEGGLTGGLFEFVEPLGLGVRVVRDRIRILPETEAICAALALDPLKLIASGALLIGVDPGATPAVQNALADEGIGCSVIGEVRPAAEGLTMVTARGVEPMGPPGQDEIARVQDA